MHLRVTGKTFYLETLSNENISKDNMKMDKCRISIPMLPDDPCQSSDIVESLFKEIDRSFKHKLHRIFVCKLFVDLIALFPSLFPPNI